jgi:hypothetical protein
MSETRFGRPPLRSTSSARAFAPFRVHAPAPVTRYMRRPLDGPLTCSRVPWVELDTDPEQRGLARSPRSGRG